MNNIKMEDYINGLIDDSNTKMDEAVKQGWQEIKFRQAGFQEALYTILAFLDKKNKEENNMT